MTPNSTPARVNCQGATPAGKAAWQRARRQRARQVIILGSLSGKRVKYGEGCASIRSPNIAAVALAHGIRHAGFDLGIRATAVCPGFVETDMARALTDAARQ